VIAGASAGTVLNPCLAQADASEPYCTSSTKPLRTLLSTTSRRSPEAGIGSAGLLTRIFVLLDVELRDA